ncbi:MAG: aminoacyl-tRNA hydrolase [Anaerovoracaceae bacterium]
MYVIVGLGNPGKKYENTRHNIGFITIDYLSNDLGIKVDKIKHKSLVGEGRISGHKVMFVKPQTFMNLSGEAVREIVDYYKVDLDKLIVIYDDIDIEKGTVRIRKKGSAGTHNGMRSILYQLGNGDFTRVRIGIGKNTKGNLADYVIGGFVKDEVKMMEEAVIHASKSVVSVIEDGVDKAMSKYNGNS